ncbi:MAG: ribosome small subunit-dependent GTPase A [Flavobacteriaceae bacterium]|jgi:ribosome biogenesis GTPase|nr:ribosome small subunit-dependent GTPase A [Pelagibacterales bacterium]MBT4709734.1 ribosome small subunit-dependent GTPase A [Flavobacteriaceae bacterium]MBT4959738.1 ribosome small subunit-dependent GTPase A [Flavobacteriaceae bacterium]MBT6169381.1 ribosome small subunit-dependent GTPase A [Flavobacteriaceae bacterium]MBT7624315.1 ribosome small subunit-dependent GTPase A [Flavobacteriaceae bacterium]|tara:strand:+ start:2924 stop:3862 length:939 start_codon:yes stop_codon:yes gene_type:complete
MKGTVYKSTGNWYSVQTDSNEVYKCNIKGKFRSLGIKSTNPIAVGDQVNFEIINKKDFTGIINRIENRKNYIIRKSVNLSKFSHIIASNIDCCFLFVTPSNPITSSIFIDRILIATKSFGIDTIILFNKTDIYSKNDIKYIDNLRDIYSKIGYKCLNISVLKEININNIIEIMKDKISIFTGHSGVGKSSLVNLLDPSLNIKTAKVSKQNEKGQHTTTYAEMYDLNFGARIIDSPGIKGFGLIDIEKSELGGYFSEFILLKDDCKFNNCLHENEPNCAVKEAVVNGVISESRYKSYRSLLINEDKSFRTDNR